MKNNPIGVFDSGVGGLSVFSRLIKLLPDENYIYFGDTLNLPYGNKTKEQLIEITGNIFDFFKSQGVKAVVMACNTTSATAYEILKSKYDYKIYPVVQTVAQSIAGKNYKNIGVFATNATVNVHAYKKEIQKYNKSCNVYETACPEWVNIVENELQNDEKSIKIIKLYLDNMLSKNVEKIILGCTHYPYLFSVLL
ncbi:MAG: glutamate racemase [Candidatus Gastranaerophilales bacterium]|nr:glutamate racemase [Candidatus Gastranaerophilales bacterium]